MSHWLLVNIVPVLIHAVCYSVVGAVVAIFVTTPLRAALKAAQKHIKVMSDSLDPEVPEGITEEVKQLRRAIDEPLVHDSNQHVHPPLRAR